MTNIIIRPMQTIAEMDAAVTMQKLYWGEDAGALVPAHMLFSMANYGGHVLAAFDEDRLIGVVIGFLGTNPGSYPAAEHLLVMSKRLVVLPEYRSQNIGYRLKLAQRDFALTQGIDLVTWTFDPVLAPNANLNIHKLGGIVKRYIPDYFGADSTFETLSADRLVVDWWVNSAHVAEHAAGGAKSSKLETLLSQGAVIANLAGLTDSGFSAPGKVIPSFEAETLLIEIPRDFTAIKDRDPALAKSWRDHLRELFLAVLDADYTVTDFARAEVAGAQRNFYILRYNFRLNPSQ